MNILVRADSSSMIGTGHIMRDLVLAKQFPHEKILFASQDLKGNINHKIVEEGYEIVTLTNNKLETLSLVLSQHSINMLIIDHYAIDYGFEKKLKDLHPNITFFILDDTYEKHNADILLNHNIYADATKYEGLVPAKCKLRCGAKFTLLRDEFRDAKNIQKHRCKTKKIFVAMGGTDATNINPLILKELENFTNVNVDLVTTTANENLHELQEYVNKLDYVNLHINATNIANLIAQSDLAIITPSVTMNEVWHMEVPFIAIQVAENQRYMRKFLEKQKCAVLKSFSSIKLYIFLLKHLKSAIHLTNFIDLSIDEKKLILSWRNNPKIRQWMLTQESIELQNHLRYINSLKEKKDRVYFLISYNNKKLGVIDFTNINKTSCEFGLYANPELKGIGVLLMKEIIGFAFNNLKVNTLKAEAFSHNSKAIELYKKCNFITTEHKQDLICMELKNENR